MRRPSLSAIVPKYEIAAELAKGIRLFDRNANIQIQEGRNLGGAWLFRADFVLDGHHIRYEDLVLMFKNSVESVGGEIVF